jgi:hypothetical protein
MSAPVTTRRVAVFTLFLFTAWIAATTAASAMRPDPPSQPGPPIHHAPAAASGPDLTVWLLAAIAVVGVVAIAAGVATALHRHHLHPPTQPAS